MLEQSLQIEKNESQSAFESPSVDINAPGQAALLARRIKDDIDAYCATTYDDGPRKHLGASLIGRECARELWYVFRWCFHKKHDGRQQRLFNRGHREEARFVEWLRGIGFTVYETDENGNQHRASGMAKGHFGGSLDGISILPARYGVKGVAAVLNEFKTSGTGHKFAALQKNGVKVEKPEHWAQMCTYGRKYGFEWAVYMSINKNDDDLHVEVVKLDWSFAEDLERKAEAIVFSQDPPKRLSESAAFSKCKFCDMYRICHEKAQIDRNCRSCKSAVPVDDGKWQCQKWNAIIPDEAIPQACSEYEAIA